MFWFLNSDAFPSAAFDAPTYFHAAGYGRVGSSRPGVPVLARGAHA